MVFGKIWESPAPSKVIAFSWQLLYDRVPTKVNLLLRGVIHHGGGEGNCVWCVDFRESSSHLFLRCKMALEVWYAIFKWLGVVIVMPPNLFHLFYCLSEAATNKKVRNGYRLVWHSVIWSIWKARNNRIFSNLVKETLEVVEDVKVISWKWSAARLKISPACFMSGAWNPEFV
ncbi:unnamed protein product [Trifolium pratense]|uniref:Uncharacterized protein n=1 Tax=Trifolium pratense TaxID=57577 RepID=A0ACB0IGT4_TRIPR|nr:unnamed protein product [Trifolium pratense]